MQDGMHFHTVWPICMGRQHKQALQQYSFKTVVQGNIASLSRHELVAVMRLALLQSSQLRGCSLPVQHLTGGDKI